MAQKKENTHETIAAFSDIRPGDDWHLDREGQDHSALGDTEATAEIFEAQIGLVI